MASSAVASLYAGLPIDHVVPEAGDLAKSLTASDILVGRRTVRFQPQTGTQVGSSTVSAAGSIVQFVLADSTSLLDTNTLRITYTKKCVSTTNATAVSFDDGAPEWRRIQVSCNGQLVDDVDNAHRNMNAMVYASANKNWMETSGSFAGYWALNPDTSFSVSGVGNTYSAPVTGGAITVVNNTATPPIATVTGGSIGVFATGLGDVIAGRANANARHVAGQDVGFALGLMSGFFRQKQYIPLFAMGELVVSLTCAANGEALWQWTGTDGTYSISDLYIECDLVQPHHDYLSMMTALTQNPSEPGLSLAYESTIVSQGTAITATNASIIVSRASNNLRKVVFTHTPTAALSALAYPNTSCFPNENINSVQIRIGSLYYPSQPSSSSARMWLQTQSAFGNPENLTDSGVVNWYLYNNSTKSDGTITNSKALNVQQLANADKFIYAMSFDNFRSGEPLDIDGVSVLGQAGSQVVLQLGYASNIESFTPNVALVCSRYVVLKNGGVSILGA